MVLVNSMFYLLKGDYMLLTLGIADSGRGFWKKP